MKSIATLLVAAVALAATLPAQAALIAVGDQLIVNGDMEDASIGGVPANWQKLGGGGFGAYEGACYSGSLGVSAWDNGKAFQDRFVDGFAPDVTGLRVEGWMRSEGGWGGLGLISIETYSMPNYQMMEYADVRNDGTGDWKVYSTIVPVHHGALETNYFSVVARSTTGNAVHIDAVKVYAIGTVPEPSTLVGLVTGLVGLLAYAWRKRK